MEEKKMNEMESLELITRMIDQTKKETAIGSGNVFLVWGYLCTFMSLVVCAMTFMTRKSGWGWLYIAIPFLGFLIAGLVARKTSKKYNAQATYQAKSIGSIWGILSAIFGAYAGICIITSVFHSAAVNVWSGMFLLGLLLPGIGTYATGVILKEDSVRMCGFIGCLFGLFFLKDFCNGSAITLYWAVLMAVAMVISLVIPGHILNNKAKKANS